MSGCEAWPYTASCDLSAVAPADLAAAVDMAQTMLWAASGRRYGVCSWSEELRSCCCVCPIECCDACRISLTKAPLVSVSSVTLPDATAPLDPSAYAVKSGQLVRLDGDHWPTYSSCVGDGLIVVYKAGTPPPPMVAVPMGDVVCELTKVGTAACRLPANVQSIVRQGVQIQFQPWTVLLGAASNLPSVQAFVAMMNPTGIQVPSKVLSPPNDCFERYVTPAPMAPRSSDLVAFSWREGDPVSKTVLALDGVAHGWLGDYQAQIRSAPAPTAPLVGTFAVTAVAVGADVQLNFVLDAAASAAILQGSYWWDAQQVGGPTRLSGTISVLSQVTVLVP